ncbi:MAG: hypothetical protein GC161_04770 [Planctomycetaceae bacterium]|nr:hypothetical protein [Planctomycetaceae bacterium]
MDSNYDRLVEQLARFDGKHTDTLEELARGTENVPGALERWLRAADDEGEERIRVAATWLLLHRCRTDPRAVAIHAPTLARLLASEPCADVRLHLLQMLDRVDLGGDLDGSAQTALLHAVRSLAEREPKAFARAWALSVLARLGHFVPRARRTIRPILADAQANGAASTKARLRQLRTSGQLDWMGS